MSATLNINADALNDLAQAVDALSGAITSDDVKLIMGRAVANTLRDHFVQIAQDSEHHKTARGSGVAPSGVYEEAARGVQQPELESDGVSVSINQVAIAQRLFGGDIEPVSAKFLAIPARSESYGKRPREFDNLQLILFPSGAAALVEREAGVVRGGRRGGEKGAGAKKVAGISSRRKGDEMGGLVYFWLVKQVHQEPDPTVLPEESEMLDAAFINAQQFIDQVWERRAV